MESNIETKVMTSAFLGDAIAALINQKWWQSSKDMNSETENIFAGNVKMIID